jgi:chromosome segregation ATPase
LVDRGTIFSMNDELLISAIRDLRTDIVADVRQIVDESVGELRDEMLTHFDGVYHRLDCIETELTAVKGGLRRVEERVTALELRVGALEERVGELDRRLGELDRRVGELDCRVGELAQRLSELENRMGAVEKQVEVIGQKLDQQLAVQAELERLKSQVAEINVRIAQIEARRTRA